MALLMGATCINYSPETTSAVLRSSVSHWDMDKVYLDKLFGWPNSPVTFPPLLMCALCVLVTACSVHTLRFSELGYAVQHNFQALTTNAIYGRE